MTIWPWTRGSRPLPETMANCEPWPTISIVVPSFNQGPFLEQCIRSVLLQEYAHLELIVVDGGSTDDSIEIIERYDPWLKCWVSEPDAGPAQELNTGFRHASGDILGFLNVDHFYLSGCVARSAEQF
ncbi:MAG: glycosyltransferase [Vicinamibacterales bacterium]